MSEIFKIDPLRRSVEASLSGESESADFKIERPDWTLFRSLATLSQKAGVPARLLRRLALKELVDNALDACCGSPAARMGVKISEPSPGVYVIEDLGPGIDGPPPRVARLFSIDRPLESSKLFRKPLRGALGNGTRVVAGCLIASGGGHLIVETNGHRLEIFPKPTGGFDLDAQPSDRTVGTRIEIKFGPDLAADDSALSWAKDAVARGCGDEYAGKSSLHWFDANALYELLLSSGTRPVRDLISNFDGCTGAKAGEIAREFLSRRCDSLTKNDATLLLGRAQALTKPPSVKRLGRIGDVFTSDGYAVIEGSTFVGDAAIPYVVEAWGWREETAEIKLERPSVNRTCITGEVNLSAWSGISVRGCGLRNEVTKTKPKKGAALTFNVTAPYVPITTDGKEPDLSPFAAAIVGALAKVLRQIPNDEPTRAKSIKDAVLENLDAAIAKASGGGRYRFSQRQVLYVLRPIVKEWTGKALEEGTFASIITAYEDDEGEIHGMIREDRGSLYHPHVGGPEMPIGTLTVETYKRPEWTFNKVVFIEKHGLFEVLKDNLWPEKHDCALMTSRGFSTRAARDLIDKLAEHDEPVTVFCVHDADSAGTMIYQTLVEETRARGARQVEVVNLGLEPWEAQAMGLEVETFARKDRRRPVADYVRARPDGAHWVEWFQSHRYELNAMTSEQFLGWLTEKIAEHDEGKVVPPPSVMQEELHTAVETEIRRLMVESILADARIDERVDAAMSEIQIPTPSEAFVRDWLVGGSENWRGPLIEASEEIVGKVDIAEILKSDLFDGPLKQA
jgi:hypothetical protein